jgi:hypothetical protein
MMPYLGCCDVEGLYLNVFFLSSYAMTKHIPLINLYDHINDVAYLGSLFQFGWFSLIMFLVVLLL